MTFLAIWILLALGRLEEVVRARRHTLKLLALGAREFYPGHYPVMVFIHLAWFILWLLEVQSYGCHWSTSWLPLACLGQGLRYWTQFHLGPRWTTRILVISGEEPVRDGPFRWLRHPNYLGVILELWAYPMACGAWRCALLIGLANALLLKWRITREEQAWKQSGNW